MFAAWVAGSGVAARRGEGCAYAQVGRASVAPAVAACRVRACAAGAGGAGQAGGAGRCRGGFADEAAEAGGRVASGAVRRAFPGPGSCTGGRGRVSGSGLCCAAGEGRASSVPYGASPSRVRLPSLPCAVFRLPASAGPGPGASCLRFPLRAGTPMLAARGYATGPGLRPVAGAGGCIPVGVHPGALVLKPPAGASCALCAAGGSRRRAGAIGAGQVKGAVQGAAAGPGRLCARRKTKEASRRAAGKRQREASRQGHPGQPAPLLCARSGIVCPPCPEPSFSAGMSWSEIGAEGRLHGASSGARRWRRGAPCPHTRTKAPGRGAMETSVAPGCPTSCSLPPTPLPLGGRPGSASGAPGAPAHAPTVRAGGRSTPPGRWRGGAPQGTLSPHHWRTPHASARARSPVFSTKETNKLTLMRGGGRGGATNNSGPHRAKAPTLPPPGPRARTEEPGAGTGRNPRARHASAAPPGGRREGPRSPAGQRPAASYVPWSTAGTETCARRCRQPDMGTRQDLLPVSYRFKHIQRPGTRNLEGSSLSSLSWAQLNGGQGRRTSREQAPLAPRGQHRRDCIAHPAPSRQTLPTHPARRRDHRSTACPRLVAPGVLPMGSRSLILHWGTSLQAMGPSRSVLRKPVGYQVLRPPATSKTNSQMSSTNCSCPLVAS